MKKLLIAIVLLSLPLLAQTAFAQRGGTPEERAERQTAMMKEELALSEDQIPKIEEINLKYAKNNEELMEKNRGDQEAMFAAFRESEKQKEGELALVLNEEQMNKLKEKKEDMRSHRRGRRGRDKS